MKKYVWIILFGLVACESNADKLEGRWEFVGVKNMSSDSNDVMISTIALAMADIVDTNIVVEFDSGIVRTAGVETGKYSVEGDQLKALWAGDSIHLNMNFSSDTLYLENRPDSTVTKFMRYTAFKD